MKHHVFLTNVPPECDWGGCERQLLDYLSEVDYTRTKVSLVATKDVFSERFERLGLPVEVLQIPFVLEGRFPQRFRKMFAFLKSLKPSHVVYVHNYFLTFKCADFLAGFIATRGNTFSVEVLGAPAPREKRDGRYFGIIPIIDWRWWRRMIPIILRGWLCRRILVVSHEVKERIAKLYHYPKKRMQVVYHGVDLEEFSPDADIRCAMRNALDIPENDTVIISAARLSTQKCLHRLINAFDSISKEHKNCWLLLLGDGPLRSDLEKLANQKPSKERIKFLGFRENVADFLRTSDIFVLPSDMEGLAICMEAAMATELACVVTKTPGATEVIRDGVNGFFVERSERGVLEGLVKVLSLSQEQREKVSRQAREFVKENLNSKNGVQKALGILEMDSKTELNDKLSSSLLAS
ncbi:MAG: glycosyltransferase [Sedimentisphaerales bacterium]|nr:glycosyltransferase [Sedimentisphaerales bacterium]